MDIGTYFTQGSEYSLDSNYFSSLTLWAKEGGGTDSEQEPKVSVETKLNSICFSSVHAEGRATSERSE